MSAFHLHLVPLTNMLTKANILFSLNDFCIALTPQESQGNLNLKHLLKVQENSTKLQRGSEPPLLLFPRYLIVVLHIKRYLLSL